MKLLHKKPKTSDKARELKKLVLAFQLISTALEQTLRTNTIISEEELETVVSNSADTLEVLQNVLGRTLQSLNESSDLHRLTDIELGVKFDREQSEVLYVVDVASVMLERLYNLRHITPKEYQSLSRYWRSIPAQHQLLLERWEKARA